MPTAGDRLVDRTRRTRIKERAFEMRVRNSSIAEIAADTGLAESAVVQLLEKELERSTHRVHVIAEHVRKLDLHRLDLMQSKLWDRIDDGDIPAIDCALRIMDRRAKLLGLDRVLVTDGRSWNGILEWPAANIDASTAPGTGSGS